MNIHAGRDMLTPHRQQFTHKSKERGHHRGLIGRGLFSFSGGHIATPQPQQFKKGCPLNTHPLYIFYS